MSRPRPQGLQPLIQVPKGFDDEFPDASRLATETFLNIGMLVGAVRPGVGANDGVRHYIARRQGKEPVRYDHPLERTALERTLGIMLVVTIVFLPIVLAYTAWAYRVMFGRVTTAAVTTGPDFY